MLLVAAMAACTGPQEVPPATPGTSIAAPATGASSSPSPAVAASPSPPVVASPSPAADGSAQPEPSQATIEHRIGVRVVQGAGEFYDRTSGAALTPRGNNLIRLDTYHDTFDPRSYDRADLDRQLAVMSGLGYNVVRVFLDHRAGGLVDAAQAPTLSGAYLGNLADFLALARNRGMYVMLTQDWLPDSSRYPILDHPEVMGININYLTASGVTANASYFRDLVRGLITHGAPLDAIWSFELRNELYLVDDQPPFSLTSGSFEAPNGRTYDLADPVARRALLEDGIVYWADTVRAAILEVDPTALVSVGFFVPQGPNPVRADDSRIVETREVLTHSSLDFVDIHGYPGLDLPLPLHLENFGLTEPLSKPVVMGEMGAFHSAYSDTAGAARALISWQADSCAYGFDGWLLWTWDTPGEIWSALDADREIGDALAPVNRPDPCSARGGVPVNLAMGEPVRTSTALADSPGSAAVDGAFESLWSSGDYARQWIEVTLAQPVRAGTVRLVVSQYPEGRTEHRIYGRTRANGSLILLHTFSGATSDGQVLAFDFAADTAVRYLRVETVKSPSWVAWREIEVSAAP